VRESANVGLGILLGERGEVPDHQIWVEEVVRGSVAYQSGKIEVGFELVAINGELVAKLLMEQVLSKHLLGADKVTLRVRRLASADLQLLRKRDHGHVKVAIQVERAVGVSKRIRTVDGDGDGLIDASELAAARGITEAEAAAMIALVDTDGNGKLDATEYASLEQRIGAHLDVLEPTQPEARAPMPPSSASPSKGAWKNSARRVRPANFEANATQEAAGDPADDSDEDEEFSKDADMVAPLPPGDNFVVDMVQMFVNIFGVMANGTLEERQEIAIIQRVESQWQQKDSVDAQQKAYGRGAVTQAELELVKTRKRVKLEHMMEKHRHGYEEALEELKAKRQLAVQGNLQDMRKKLEAVRAKQQAKQKTTPEGYVEYVEETPDEAAARKKAHLDGLRMLSESARAGIARQRNEEEPVEVARRLGTPESSSRPTTPEAEQRVHCQACKDTTVAVFCASCPVGGQLFCTGCFTGAHVDEKVSHVGKPAVAAALSMVVEDNGWLDTTASRELDADIQVAMKAAAEQQVAAKTAKPAGCRRFSMTDIDLNGDGKVDAAELALARGVSLAEAAAMIATADTDGDGKLDIDEFSTLEQHLHFVYICRLCANLDPLSEAMGVLDISDEDDRAEAAPAMEALRLLLGEEVPVLPEALLGGRFAVEESTYERSSRWLRQYSVSPGSLRDFANRCYSVEEMEAMAERCRAEGFEMGCTRAQLDPDVIEDSPAAPLGFYVLAVVDAVKQFALDEGGVEQAEDVAAEEAKKARAGASEIKLNEMDTDGDGMVDMAELAAARGISLDEAAALIAAADQDGDGKLDVHELEYLPPSMRQSAGQRPPPTRRPDTHLYNPYANKPQTEWQAI
jgi:Ca2+-binding EF-hand superfamily protein